MTATIIIDEHVTPVPAPRTLVCSVCDERMKRVSYYTNDDAQPFCSLACVRREYPAIPPAVMIRRRRH